MPSIAKRTAFGEVWLDSRDESASALAVGNGALWLISTLNGPSGFFYEEWTHGAGVGEDPDDGAGVPTLTVIAALFDRRI